MCPPYCLPIGDCFYCYASPDSDPIFLDFSREVVLAQRNVHSRYD